MAGCRDSSSLCDPCLEPVRKLNHFCFVGADPNFLDELCNVFIGVYERSFLWNHQWNILTYFRVPLFQSRPLWECLSGRISFFDQWVFTVSSSYILLLPHRRTMPRSMCSQ